MHLRISLVHLFVRIDTQIHITILSAQKTCMSGSLHIVTYNQRYSCTQSRYPFKLCKHAWKYSHECMCICFRSQSYAKHKHYIQFSTLAHWIPWQSRLKSMCRAPPRKHHHQRRVPRRISVAEKTYLLDGPAYVCWGRWWAYAQFIEII